MPSCLFVRHGLLIVAILVATIYYRPFDALGVNARARVLRDGNPRVGREEVQQLSGMAAGKPGVQVPRVVVPPVLERRYADGHGIRQNAKSPRRLPRAWFANMKAQ